MKYALVNLVPVELELFNRSIKSNELVLCSPGTVINIIVLNPNDTYHPSENTKLVLVQDTINIGDFVGID